jgi:hypothetical protein
MSGSGDHGNPFPAANPLVEFLKLFLQISSYLARSQPASINEEIAFETARLISQEAKALADREQQQAVMQIVMACSSVCSAAYNTVGGVAKFDTVSPGGISGALAHATDETEIVQAMLRIFQHTIDTVIKDEANASQQILAQVNQMLANSYQDRWAA